MVGKGGGGNEGGGQVNPDPPPPPESPDFGDGPGGVVASDLAVDPHAMRAYADAIHRSAHQVGLVLRQMENETAPFNGIWGHDETGRSIEQTYPDSRNWLLEGVGYVHDILDVMSMNLRASATAFETAEENAAADAAALTE